jgi:hypothetical protein
MFLMSSAAGQIAPGSLYTSRANNQQQTTTRTTGVTGKAQPEHSRLHQQQAKDAPPSKYGALDISLFSTNNTPKLRRISAYSAQITHPNTVLWHLHGQTLVNHSGQTLVNPHLSEQLPGPADGLLLEVVLTGSWHTRYHT